MKSRVFVLTSLLAALAVMVSASSALAQSAPADTVYKPQGEVLNVIQGGGPAQIERGGTAASRATTPAAVDKAGPGSLPFTGFEVAIVALAGMALVGTGFAMRRVARRDS